MKKKSIKKLQLNRADIRNLEGLRSVAGGGRGTYWGCPSNLSATNETNDPACCSEEGCVDTMYSQCPTYQCT